MTLPEEVTAAPSRASLSWQALHLSLRGASHVRRDTPCEDCSSSAVARAGSPWTDRGEGDWAFVVVADGHGSDNCFRSHRGADFAVEVLTGAFTEFKRSLVEDGGHDARPAATVWKDTVSRYVVGEWRSLVYQDLVEDPPDIGGDEEGLHRYLRAVLDRRGHPALERTYLQMRAFEQRAAEIRAQRDPENRMPPLPPTTDPRWDAESWGTWQAKAYGATLLGVLLGPHALHWFQLGDGAMVKIVGGEADWLVPPPSEAIANQTPSLSGNEAVLAVETGTLALVERVPSAVLLTTDGVPNSYDELHGFFEFCEDIANHAADRSWLAEQLPEWLTKISTKGSGDDMSVAMAWVTETESDTSRRARRSTAGDGRPRHDVGEERPDVPSASDDPSEAADDDLVRAADHRNEPAPDEDDQPRSEKQPPSWWRRSRGEASEC